MRISFALAVVLSIAVLPWDLRHLGTEEGWRSAWGRTGSFLSGFASPDLSSRTLTLAAELTAETLAIAVLGVSLALLLAYPLAVLASDAVLDDGAGRGRSRSRIRTVVREVFRFLLDAMRGVPDFAWALVLLTIFGPTALTAVLAIAVNAAGILGKIFSELWDGVPRAHRDVLRSAGASRWQVLIYGTQPLAGRAMLSFLLMRFECTVRNASVIGAVCGGGLGAAVLQEIGYDNKARGVTFLGAALLLTVAVDFASNALRRLVRQERNTTIQAARLRRRIAGFGVASAIGASLFLIRRPILELGTELRRLDLRYLREHYGQLLVPDLSGQALGDALQGVTVPLALGVLSTLIACGLAVVFAWLGSATFQLRAHEFAPERTPGILRLGRTAVVVVSRVVSAILRGLPEVAWVWILALFFLTGVEAALGALLLHSAGVLARVFTESVDNVPYRRLEHIGAPSRASAFVHGAVPLVRLEWRTYAMFQFESNVRAGVVLGIVGVGGLGFLFRSALAHGSMGRASTFLLTMVLLTVVIDRISRRIQRGPRC